MVQIQLNTIGTKLIRASSILPKANKRMVKTITEDKKINTPNWDLTIANNPSVTFWRSSKKEPLIPLNPSWTLSFSECSVFIVVTTADISGSVII